MITMRNAGYRPESGHAADMTTSPLSPDDIRAAAEVHNELGPEYSDAVVASFLEKSTRKKVSIQLRCAGRRLLTRRDCLESW